MNKRGGLGRGLGALIPSGGALSTAAGSALTELPVAAVVPKRRQPLQSEKLDEAPEVMTRQHRRYLAGAAHRRKLVCSVRACCVDGRRAHVPIHPLACGHSRSGGSAIWTASDVRIGGRT